MSYDRSAVMLSYVPEYYRESRIYNAHNTAKGLEIDVMREVLDELQLQFTPQTATWAIYLWEELCGLPTIPSKDIELRRGKVLSILGTSAPMTEKLLSTLIHTAAGAIIHFEDTGQPYVMAAIVTEFCRRVDMALVREIILNAAPAHLEFFIKGKVEVQAQQYLGDALTIVPRLTFTEPMPTAIDFVGKEYNAPVAAFVPRFSFLDDESNGATISAVDLGRHASSLSLSAHMRFSEPIVEKMSAVENAYQADTLSIRPRMNITIREE